MKSYQKDTVVQEAQRLVEADEKKKSRAEWLRGTHTEPLGNH